MRLFTKLHLLYVIIVRMRGFRVCENEQIQFSWNGEKSQHDLSQPKNGFSIEKARDSNGKSNT